MIGDYYTIQNNNSVWDFGIHKGSLGESEVVYLLNSSSFIQKICFAVRKFFGNIDCSSKAWKEYEATYIAKAKDATQKKTDELSAQIQSLSAEKTALEQKLDTHSKALIHVKAELERVKSLPAPRESNKTVPLAKKSNELAPLFNQNIGNINIL